MKEHILEFTRLGFEFEFYSNFTIFETASSLEKLLEKKVVIPMIQTDLEHSRPLYHSPIKVTSSLFKLEPDFSGGKNMMELVTGVLSYKEAREVLTKVLNWISENGYTNERCGIHVNLSLDTSALGIERIQNLNVLKFCTTFSEQFVFDRFPSRKGNVYARSIKKLYFNNSYYSDRITFYDNTVIKLPTDVKYYVVNFLKREKNYLEYRPLGGKDYHKAESKIVECIDYFVEHLYSVLKNPELTNLDKQKLLEILDVESNFAHVFNKYEYFVETYPNFKVTIDMSDDLGTIDTYWYYISEKIKKIIVGTKTKECHFNFDREIDKMQIKNAIVESGLLEDIDIVSSKISGFVNRCRIVDSELKNSHIHDTELLGGNRVIFCKVELCKFEKNNKLKDCYIDNKNLPIECEVDGGVIRSGTPTKKAIIKKNVLFVN